MRSGFGSVPTTVGEERSGRAVSEWFCALVCDHRAVLDLHTHVWPHRPGTATPTLDEIAAYCDAARSSGITEIAITEHSHRFDRLLDQVFSIWERPRSGDVADATDHVLDIEGGGDLDAYVAGASITTASDAHTVEQIGYRFDVLERKLDARGVTELTSFRGRQAIHHPRPLATP